jgi:hypothetical protein
MEGPNFEKRNSAEQAFLIEKSDPEMRLAAFIHDPQEYINQFHDYLQSSHPNESEHAILAVNEIYDLETAIRLSNFTELPADLEVFLAAEGAYDPGVMHTLLTWLREAGYTQKQVSNWVAIEQNYIDIAGQAKGQSVQDVFNQVFAEE